LREEHRLRVFENRVLRKIFVPKRAEVTGEWRRLHSEELYDLYSSSNITFVVKSKTIRWAVHVTHILDKRIAYRIFVCKRDGKRPPGRPRSTREDNIRIDLQEIKWEGFDKINLAQNRDKWRAVVNMVINLWVSIKFGEFHDQMRNYYPLKKDAALCSWLVIQAKYYIRHLKLIDEIEYLHVRISGHYSDFLLFI
jgi:hypothetical protein